MTRLWWLVLLLQFDVSLSTDAFTPNVSRECPENEQYTTCSSSRCFEAVCGVASTPFCTKDCKAGCQCMRGFARREEVCVPLAECTGTSAIIWKNGGTPGRMGALRLQSQIARCVVASPLSIGAILSMHDCDKKTDLQLDMRGERVIRISSRPELCVAANSSDALEAGQRLVLAECSETANQQFQLDRMDGTIRLASDTTLCLENRNPSTVLALAVCSGANEQQWELTDNGCIPAQTAPLIDYGAADEYRGWYDTQGCGTCRDYCRWIGNTSGGDPALNQLVGVSHWSCGLAGFGSEFTLPMHFEMWNFTKCSTIISDQELRRSADAARNLALILQAELPMTPRSVPRRSRAPSPSGDPAPSQVLNASGSNATGASNVNVTRMWAAPQVVPASSSSNDYAIPLGVVGGLLVLALLLFLFCRYSRKKETESPLATTVPVVATVVATTIPAPSVSVAIPPRIVVLPVAVDDPPPPYHAIDTATWTRE